MLFCRRGYTPAACRYKICYEGADFDATHNSVEAFNSNGFNLGVGYRF